MNQQNPQDFENLKISQQVSATYARNHFKEINERAMREGLCVIVKKSKPITVVISFEEYQKLQKRQQPKKTKKMTLKELEEKSIFKKYSTGKWAKKMKEKYGNLTSVELQHKWAEYVD